MPDTIPLPPGTSPATIARAILLLRAKGKLREAKLLEAHLPPSSPPLPHLDAMQGQANGAAPQADEVAGPSANVGGLAISGVPRPSNPQSQGSLPPRIDKAYEVFGNARPEPAHSFGCVYLVLPEPQRSRVLAMAAQIADDELADRGREDDAHITALHGLTDDAPHAVFSILAHFRPVRVKLGRVSIFPGAEYDVVKIDVESDSAHRMNAALRSLPHHAKFRDYRPHVTIALVRPGLGALIAMRLGDFNDTCVCDTAILSDAAEHKYVIPLGRTITVHKAAMSAYCDSTGGALVAPASGSRRPVKLKRKRRLFSRIQKALEEVEGGASSDLFFPNGTEGEAGEEDNETFVFGEKAFDESAVTREKSAHDDKRPGEFAPRTSEKGGAAEDSQIPFPLT